MKKRKVFGIMLPIIGFALVLAAAGCGTGGNSAPFGRDDFDFGEAEVAVPKADRDAKGLYWWPDGPMGWYHEGGGSYVFYSANGGSVAMTAGAQDNPLAAGAASVISVSGVKEPNYGYLGGGPVYKLDDNTMLLFYHMEKHPKGNGTIFYDMVGVAVSKTKDGDGRFTNFEDLGIVLHHAKPYSDDATGAVYGFGGTFAVHDKYFYSYNEENPNDPEDDRRTYQLTVARASIDEIKAAVNEGRPPLFKKYYNGGWTADGLGGKPSPLDIGGIDNFGIDVSYNSYLGKFLMVASDYEADGADVYLAASDDGINWGEFILIADEPGELYAPTIVGGPEERQRETGKEFYVYYTHSIIGASDGWKRWNDGNLVRRKITLK